MVLPVELLVGAVQEAVPDQRQAFRLGQEGEVDRGGLALAAEFEQAGGQPARTLSASGEGRTSSRRPVAGVNGTETWSLG